MRAGQRDGSAYNAPMSRDTLRLVLVAAAVVGAILAIPAYRGVRELVRIHPVAAVVVTATPSDPVFRDGDRHLAPGEPFTAAVAVRIRRPGGRLEWIAPVERLTLGGVETPHRVTGRWPERDRTLRVLWMTVEAPRRALALEAGQGAEALGYRTFLAPEMGRGMLAERMPELHADDYLARGAQAAPGGPGTVRLAARVEVVRDPASPLADEAVTSPADPLGEPAPPVLSRAMAAPEGVDPSCGELFGLPGVEGPDPTVLAALARRRLAVSSWTLAAVAVAGDPGLEPGALARRAELRWRPGLRGGPSWGRWVRAGDLLREGGHWLVLLADDGDGRLSGGDLVLHAWRAPAAAVPLEEALPEAPARLELYRRGR